jgi:Carboxymuconolactone decarboxylase family
MQARMKNPAMVVPGVMQALQALSKSVEKALPERTLDLVHLRASQINGCSVCVDMHARRPAKPTSASSPSPPGGMRLTLPTPNALPSRSPRRRPGSATARIRCPTKSGLRPLATTMSGRWRR